MKSKQPSQDSASKAPAVATRYGTSAVGTDPERLFDQLFVDVHANAPSFDELTAARLREQGCDQPNEEWVFSPLSTNAGQVAMRNYVDAMTGQEAAACEIAFAVGLAYGRATAGGAR